MRRVILSLAVGFVGLTSALAWVDRRADCPEPPPLKHSFKRWEAESKLKVAGVGSCASMACHNGNGPRGSKGSEYSTWVALDPHAKAFQALYKPESKRMHAILSAAFPDVRKYKSATTNPLCLSCHGMGHNVEERYQADGAGCERCHGPAEKWRTTHYLDEFDRKTPGFVDTRCDFAARAFTCMKCHVGDPAQEVDHVLIAAGHPRLRFEYAAYYANYPRHWAPLGEKETDPTLEAFTWSLGQLVTARAALELLVARASDDSAKAKNWPEFAEYDCTACHHDLKKKSPRQEYYLRQADRDVIPRVKRVGELPWGTWYYPLLPTLKKDVAGAPNGLEANLAALDQLMRRKDPPRPEVRQQATALIGQLDGWITQLVQAEAKCAKKPGSRSFSDAQLRTIVRDLSKQTDPVMQGWDGGSQVYLGLAAMNQARSDADPVFKMKMPYRGPLADVRVGLKTSFEPNSRIPDHSRTLYDTPNDYFKRLDSIFKGLEAFRKPD